MVKPKIIPFSIVFGLTASIYAFTLCPTVEFIDSGELALACKHLGIAHPTGYPLYTVLGRLAAMIPWGDLVSRLNLLSLLFTALAAGFLALAIIELLSSRNEKNGWKTLIACCAASFAALSPVWWAQGTTNEVYSLNLLLLSISIFSFLKYLESGEKAGRWLLFTGYIFGLSLTNHLSAIYLLPGFIVIIGLNLWKRRLITKTFIWLILFMIFPLTLYFLLPIRAGFSPFLNWGGVNDPYFLYKHISGWQYRIWMFSDSNFDAVAERLIYSVKLIFRQFGWFGLLAGFLGFLRMTAKKGLISLFLGLIILLNLIYASNYQIADIDAYYLPIILAISMYIAYGLFSVINRVIDSFKSRKSVKFVFAGVLIILPLSNLFDNFLQSNRTSMTYAKQGAIDLVGSMDPDGLALVENWDFYSPWLYLHYEENYRPDIILIDKELTRRSWYIDFIKRNYPDIYGRSKARIDEFLRRVEPFERNQPFDPNVIDKAYYDMLKAIIENESAVRPVYTNAMGDPKFIEMLPLVPDGILFKVYNSPDFLKNPLLDFDESYWGSRFIYKEARVGHLLSYYRRAFQSREKYCRHFGEINEADYYKRLAADVSKVISDIK